MQKVTQPRQHTMGYHIRSIPQGTYGEASKIEEEVTEFFDAVEQGNPIMALAELSDLVGAIEGWLEEHHPSIKIMDVLRMAQATRHAFESGQRVPRQ